MGTVFKFGDNIDTDVIVPGQYLSISDPGELAKICMIGHDPSLAAKIQVGDIFVCGKNFGSGSSREHAPLAIRAAGVSCVIAVSFARIFFRNAINLGLAVLESPEAVEQIRDGDRVDVDLLAGVIADETRGLTFSFAPFPPGLMAIIEAGGLEAFYNKRN